jgi:hypothetical protein
MSDIPGQANSVYRDFVIDDAPSSGEHHPPKADVRELFADLGDELDTLQSNIDAVSAAVTAELEIAVDQVATALAEAQAAEAAAEAAASAAQALVDDAATGYLSFETTAAMTAHTTATEAQTAYNAETDSYYRWDDGESEWVLVRTAENTRITALEDRVIPALIDADHTVTGSNEVLDVDTTDAEVEVTLKASPSDRDRVVITDIKGMFATHNCIINGNGNTIGGTGTSVRCREEVPMTLTIVYDSTADTWRLFVMT